MHYFLGPTLIIHLLKSLLRKNGRRENELQDSSITIIFAVGFLVFITIVAMFSIIPLGTNKVLLHDVKCNRIVLESLEPSDYRLDVDVVPTEFAQAFRSYKISITYDNRFVGEGELSWTQAEVRLVDRPKRLSFVLPNEQVGDICEVGKVGFQAEG